MIGAGPCSIQIGKTQENSMEHTAVARTPYDLVGGMETVREFVDRFYDLLEQDDSYAALRALHAPDLAPMRTSLTGFLAAWLGGPRDWFEDHPGLCMMSAHRDVQMTPETGRQWADAMIRAIQGSSVEPALGAKMAHALGDLATRMAQ
jgi:hemoglobin